MFINCHVLPSKLLKRLHVLQNIDKKQRTMLWVSARGGLRGNLAWDRLEKTPIIFGLGVVCAYYKQGQLLLQISLNTEWS